MLFLAQGRQNDGARRYILGRNTAEETIKLGTKDRRSVMLFIDLDLSSGPIRSDSFQQGEADPIEKVSFTQTLLEGVHEAVRAAVQSDHALIAILARRSAFDTARKFSASQIAGFL